MIKAYILPIWLLLVIPSTVSAANWYVDNAATGNNDGTSWTNSWTSFSGINWGAIMPGDTIYISGGTTSKTYNERLVIGASGAAGNRITVKVGQDTGHNGIVIITNSPYDALLINSKSYIVISGQVGSSNARNIRITNNKAGSGIAISGNSDYLLFEYLEIDNNGNSDPRSGFESDVLINPKDWEIRYNYIHDNYQDGLHLCCGGAEEVDWGKIIIHHNTIVNTHDDAIECGLFGVSIYNNVMGDSIEPVRGHPDGMQLYGSYYKIYNNYLHGFRDQDGNSVIYIEPGGSGPGFSPFGHVWIYNNVFYENQSGNLANGAICIAISGDAFQIANDIKVLNNVIVGHYVGLLLAFSGALLGGSGVSDYYVENNIVDSGGIWYDTGDIPGDSITYGNHGESASVIIDYNNFYNTGYSGGKNSHGTTSNPLLDANQRPTANSTAVIDNGYDWSGIYTTDKDDIARPQGPAWDMGAYEYVLSGCIHKSDADCNSCVSDAELSAFIDLWHMDSSNPTLRELMEAIGLWKAGC